MTEFESARNRAQGSFLAAAAGDALGWPQEARGGMVGGKRAREARRPQAEFTGWTRGAGSRFMRYQDPVEAGAYSDDTQLLLAVARACLSDDWVQHLATVELPAWPFYQRGGGRAVLLAASAWAENRPPWVPTNRPEGAERTNDYFRAGANGVAMRIAPHVLWSQFNTHSSGSSRLIERVVRDGVLTHGHPRALVGAAAYAAALDFAFESTQTVGTGDLLYAARSGLRSPEEVMSWLPDDWFAHTENRPAGFAAAWLRTNDEMESLLRIVETSIRQGSMSHATDTLTQLGAIGEFAGSGTISAAAAIYLASRSGTRPISGLLQGAFQHGADTDTIASMAGGLLGAIHGHAWLGQLREVQDSHYLAVMGDALISGVSYSVSGRQQSLKAVARELEDEFRDEGTFVDGRRYKVASRLVLSERPWAARFMLRLEDGQSVAVDCVHRARPNQPRFDDIPFLRPTPQPDGNSQSTSAIKPSNAALLVTVTLPVSDLETAGRFYSDLLGRPLAIEGSHVIVSPALRFVRAQGDPALWSADAHVEVETSDLKATAARLGLPVVPDKLAGARALTIDPDGRSVTIRQAV